MGFLDNSNIMELAKKKAIEDYPVIEKYITDEIDYVLDDRYGYSEYFSPTETGLEGNVPELHRKKLTLSGSPATKQMKATVAINPKFAERGVDHLSGAIVGETLHHMKEYDEGWKKLWNNFDTATKKDPRYKEFNRGRQAYYNRQNMKRYSQEANRQGYVGTESAVPLDKRPVEDFIKYSANDEFIRASLFSDHPVMGKYFDQTFKGSPVEQKYKTYFSAFKKYLNNRNFLTTKNKGK